MNKKGLLAIVTILIIVAVCTSGLMRAAIELSIFFTFDGLLIHRQKKEDKIKSKKADE